MYLWTTVHLLRGFAPGTGAESASGAATVHPVRGFAPETGALRPTPADSAPEPGANPRTGCSPGPHTGRFRPRPGCKPPNRVQPWPRTPADSAPEEAAATMEAGRRHFAPARLQGAPSTRTFRSGSSATSSSTGVQEEVILQQPPNRLHSPRTPCSPAPHERRISQRSAASLPAADSTPRVAPQPPRRDVGWAESPPASVDRDVFGGIRRGRSDQRHKRGPAARRERGEPGGGTAGASQAGAQTTRWARAHRANSWRSETWSLRRTAETCVSMVFTLRNNSPAASR